MPQYKIKRLKFKEQNKVERESDFAYYSLIPSPLPPLFFLKKKKKAFYFILEYSQLTMLW